MGQSKTTFETVREIGLSLPGVEAGTRYGQPALLLGGVLLACLPAHRSAEPDSLVVRVDFEQRAALLEEAPGTYYLTPHYQNHPVVLARMSRISMDEVRGLLAMALRIVTPAAKRPAANRGKRGTSSRR